MENGTLSGSVLVEHNGMLFKKGYGMADKDTHILNTPQTRFRLGSVTKQFTAMAILMLQERGKLHVQDLLCRYVPDCPQDWQTITLEQLLTHTSGIPDYTDFSDFIVTWTQHVTVEQLIARFKNKPLDFTPGSVFHYSNSGYVVLGYIIERITGETYATFLQKNIFDPLAMHNTGYDSKYPVLPQHATGYYKDYTKPDAYDMSIAYAAGALYSTVEDMYIWNQALATHRLVSQQSLDAMFALHVPCPPPGSPKGCISQNDKGYGYGWFLANEAQGRLIYHVGRIDGFLAYNGFYRNKNLDAVVLSNLETTDVGQIGRMLAGMV
jgi:CubicO group peptidase (beta-lactamase class C family)